MPMQTSHALAAILDGTKIAAEIKDEVAAQVKELATQGIRPGLAAVLAGNDPARGGIFMGWRAAWSRGIAAVAAVDAPQLAHIAQF